MTDILQPLSAVILVLSLLGGVLWYLRRRGMASFPSAGLPFGRTRQSNPANRWQLKIVDRIPLGAQHALHLVQVGDRLILVATSPGSCRKIDCVHEGTRHTGAGIGL
jgi:flagellar biogenesis protein FliO